MRSTLMRSTTSLPPVIPHHPRVGGGNLLRIADYATALPLCHCEERSDEAISTLDLAI